MTPRQQEVLDLRERLGSNSAVARHLGLDESTVRETLRRAQSNLESGVKDALERTGLSEGTATHGWRRVQDKETGSWNSVFWKMPQDQETLAERIRDALNGIAPIEPIAPPETIISELCTVYPLMDVHLGMLADKDETGAVDYDIRHALADMRHAFAKIGALTPASSKAILIVGGDFFHANDNSGQTPTHKHSLDTDTRHWKVLQAGVQFLAEVIDLLARKHSTVVLRVLRGNHDPEAHMVLTFAMQQRYRADARIEVDASPRDLFMATHGKCLIAAHHGDRAPPERLTLYLSDVCPFWSETRHRYCFTGHIHKDQARDVGPLRWESLRAFAPPDAYAAGMGYSGRRAMQALTFHERDGLVLRALDPIER